MLVAGATTAVTDATAACGGFPLCGGQTTTAALVTLTHRALAVVVGLLVAGAGWLALRRRPRRRVSAALGVAVGLFPVQAAVGAAVAVVGPAEPLAGLFGLRVSLGAVHLAVGVSIFAGLLAALTWELEAATGDPTDEPTDAPTTPTGEPVATDSPAVPTWDEPLRRTLAVAAAYYRLMKPRLMWLLCLVAAASMALAAGPSLSPSVTARTLVGGALAIGASGTFNHVLERDVDRRMHRTSDRPLAVDLVSVPRAVAFGTTLGVISLGVFASINLLTAALGAVAIGFYAVIYTLVLKPNTVQNTVLGGAAGALPALIGWAAATGTIGLGGIGLAAVIFLWTPSHFYNLALAYEDDYERAGFPMMPVVRGATATRRHICWYLLATLVASAALVGVERLDWLYATAGVLVGTLFLWAVIRLHHEQTQRAAFRAFHASNAYLGIVLIAAVVDALVV